MNRFIIFSVGLYRLLFRSKIASCRFEPTCSQYLISATQKYGTLKGVFKSMLRVSSCHPFSKRPLYDPA